MPADPREKTSPTRAATTRTRRQSHPRHADDVARAGRPYCDQRERRGDRHGPDRRLAAARARRGRALGHRLRPRPGHPGDGPHRRGPGAHGRPLAGRAVDRRRGRQGRPGRDRHAADRRRAGARRDRRRRLRRAGHRRGLGQGAGTATRPPAAARRRACAWPATSAATRWPGGRPPASPRPTPNCSAAAPGCCAWKRRPTSADWLDAGPAHHRPRRPGRADHRRGPRSGGRRRLARAAPAGRGAGHGDHRPAGRRRWRPARSATAPGSPAARPT